MGIEVRRGRKRKNNEERNMWGGGIVWRRMKR